MFEECKTTYQVKTGPTNTNIEEMHTQTNFYLSIFLYVYNYLNPSRPYPERIEKIKFEVPQRSVKIKI